MKRAIVVFVTLAFAIGSIVSAGGDTFDYQAYLQEQNTPIWVRNTFYNNNLYDQYEISYHINPCYLRGDFNGDGETDVAILVRRVSDKKLGIAVLHFGLDEWFFLGAGTPIGNGGDNFTWMDVWTVAGPHHYIRENDKNVAASQDALYVEKSESASGLIYFDGKRYIWEQKGD